MGVPVLILIMSGLVLNLFLVLLFLAFLGSFVSTTTYSISNTSRVLTPLNLESAVSYPPSHRDIKSLMLW